MRRYPFLRCPCYVATAPSTTPSLSVTEAISKAESALNGTYNQHPTTVEYVAKQDGSLALTHVVQVRDDDKAMWYEAFVDAHSGDIVQLTDFVAHASVCIRVDPSSAMWYSPPSNPQYRVLPITKQNITQGSETLTDPQNLAASPLGWHNDGVTNTTDTS